jgi:hypothetical protein
MILILLPLPLLTASSPAFLFKVEVILSIDVLFDVTSTLAASSFGNEAILDQCCCFCLCLASLSLPLFEMPLLPPLLPSTPGPPLLLSPSLQPAIRLATSAAANSPAEPHARDAGIFFIASSAACAAFAANFASAAAAADAADTVSLLYLPLPALTPLPLL